jgi:hypothetical protein
MFRCLLALAVGVFAEPPSVPLKIDYVYTDNFIHEIPSHVAKLPNLPGHAALYIFWPDGRLDTVECGQVYNFDTGRMWVDLADPLVEHGQWEKTRAASVVITLPGVRSPRMPPPPGAALERGNRRYELVLSGPARGGLTERMAALNSSLVAVKQLTNLRELELLLRSRRSSVR